MHNDLTHAFDKLVDLLKADARCMGGWHFGSVGRGTSDEYSDYDPVFLVADKDFEQFAADVPKLMVEISDELLICWAENFNSRHFKNFCNVIRVNDGLHQLDFFMLNHDYPDEWICKLHCNDCTINDIIFDRDGETAKFLSKGYGVESHIPDAARAMDTYWFHVMMLPKYFKRGDMFKVLKNIDILFHAHVDLLLSEYDTLNWGGWESKVKHCLPDHKQEHLKTYFATADFDSLGTAVKQAVALFSQDSAEICKTKGIDYPESVVRQITTHFYESLPCLAYK